MFNLTTQERNAIIFLLCLVTLGIGFDFFRKATHRDRFSDYQKLEEGLVNKIDINEAKFSQIVNIPGVGEGLAKAIIDYRDKQGKFKSFDELKNVKGIKDKKLEKLKEYFNITID